MYKKAVELFLKKLDDKTTWGKEELKKLMLQCILDVSE